MHETLFLCWHKFEDHKPPGCKLSKLFKTYLLDLFIFMQKGKDKYIYGGWWSVWWTGTYSMVLSKAAFFHKKYLKLYTDEMPASIKEYINRNRSLLITTIADFLNGFIILWICLFIIIPTPRLDSPGIVKILQCHFLLQMQQVLLPYG